MPRDTDTSLVRRCYEVHTAEWSAKRATLKKFKDLYGSRFWGDQPKNAGAVRVETGDGPAHIESYLAALFSRSPAVEVGPDLTHPDRDPRITQGVANKWLGKRRRPFEQATRVGLIYPMAFLRVGPNWAAVRAGPLDRVDVVCALPWDVILDYSASDWDHQRWVGHRYLLPLAHARKRWPNVKDWKPGVEARYFQPSDGDKNKESDVPADLQNVQIVEFYDLVRSQLIFWSPDREQGERDKPLKVSAMPLNQPGTRTPIHPIVPLYFQYEPDSPMEGIATLSRLYDQFYEKNLLRTQQANNVRKDARQWEAPTGYYSPDDEVKIAAGVDGLVVHPADPSLRPPGSQVGLVAIPVAANPGSHERYDAAIGADIEHGAPLAAFSRGEATRTTATEIGVLAQYTASAIGRMARERDAAIERVAELYVAHLELSREPTLTVLDVAGVPTVVHREDLDAKWEIQALDQAGTPMSQAIEQQRFTTLLPLLLQMGVPPQEILREMVRLQMLSPKFHALADQVPPASGANPQAQPGADDQLSEDQLFQLATRPGAPAPPPGPGAIPTGSPPPS